MSSVVITVGRMNPPTIGHLRVFERMKEIATENGSIPMYVVLTHTHDNINNPLRYEEKRTLLEHIGVNVSPETDRTIYQAVERLAKEGVKTFHLVVGVDRADLADGLNRYKEKWGFDNVILHSLERSENSDTESLGCSATKVRESVRKVDKETYNRLIGVKEGDKEPLWGLLRERLTNPTT